MPMKRDAGANLQVAGTFDGGCSWIAHPDETMQRASHALTAGDGVWLIDPVDAPGLDDELADLGDVVGVVVLLDRHKRDATAVATRHEVPVFVPASMTGVVSALDAPTERFDDELADTGFEAIDVVNNRFWQEVALADEDGGTLVVAESVGTSEYFLADEERLGVHPMLRLRPPRAALERYSPERVLVGHGAPVLEDAAAALADALAHGRRRTPQLYAGTLKSLLTG
jgi:hypothetical protein